MLIEDLILAVAHDRVEVEVEALPLDQPGRLLAGHERSKQCVVVSAGGAVGVGGQVGALGQDGQSAEGTERGVVHDVVDVRATATLVALQRQQRQQRVDRGKLAGAGVAGRGHERGQVELEQLGEQQEQSCVLRGAPTQRPPVLVAQSARLRRYALTRRGRRLYRQRPETLLAQELPDRSAPKRRAGCLKRAPDLTQRATLAAQPQREYARTVLLGLAARPRP